MLAIIIIVYRLIQEEKENTEARAEELEYRVSSLDHLVGSHVGNHAAGSGRSTPRVAPSNHSPVVAANLTAYANTSSPLANQNAAASPQRDYLHKFHTVLERLSFLKFIMNMNGKYLRC